MFWKPVDGTGTVESLIDNGTGRTPYSFTPDGTRLVHLESGVLSIMSLVGDRAATPLWEGAAEARRADLSSDGRWLAYESARSGQREIYVRPFPNVDDGARRIWTGRGSWPLWNPDPDEGHELFYVGPQGMMIVTVETEPTPSFDQPALLFDTDGYGVPENIGLNRRMAIHPDGERFLMFKEAAATNEAPEPILIQNWFDELQRLVPTP